MHGLSGLLLWRDADPYHFNIFSIFICSLVISYKVISNSEAPPTSLLAALIGLLHMSWMLNFYKTYS